MAWVTSVRGLLTYAVLVRLITITLLLAASSRVPSFDKSAFLLLPPSHHYLEPFVRWDTLYFVKIAFRGYQNEQELAFTPGLPLVMRIVGMGIRLAKGQSGAVEVPDVVMGGLVACFIAGVGATLALYKYVRLNDLQTLANISPQALPRAHTRQVLRTPRRQSIPHSRIPSNSQCRTLHRSVLSAVHVRRDAVLPSTEVDLSFVVLVCWEYL
jgi:hypothetical protein